MLPSVGSILQRRYHSLYKISKYAASSGQLQELPKYEYKGPSSKPSILIRNHHIDSSVWDDFIVDDKDIYVNTPAKAGTTWMQEIVGQLLYKADMIKNIGTDCIHDVSPWLAMALTPPEMKQALDDQLRDDRFPRRIIKTHEPVESMQFNQNSKYIFVARDFRDIAWSAWNHYSMFADQAYEMMNAPRDYDFKKLPKYNYEDGSFTEKDMFNSLLFDPDDDGNPDGFPMWSQLWVIGSWWRIKDLPNVKIIHYANLKEDLSGCMKDIAEFLEIEIDESTFNQAVELCTFASMKARKVAPIPPQMAHVFCKDRGDFFNKGTVGRWQNVLNEEDAEKMRYVARRYLNDDGIYWMETGKFQ